MPIRDFIGKHNLSPDVIHAHSCLLETDRVQKWFDMELAEILAPYGICVRVAKVENSCLLGAALAAYAKPM